MRRMVVLIIALALAACGSARTHVPSRSGVPGYAAGDYSCVPYARQRSGIQLAGDAWEWWDASSGRYDRASAPQPGAVLVLMRSSRLGSGHLAVVTRVVSPREIRVDHANWASGLSRGQVARNQPVLDVSPDNDWSLVRVWYPRIDEFGITAYPAYGFILPALQTAAAE